jgi:hypothetical protein
LSQNPLSANSFLNSDSDMTLIGKYSPRFAISMWWP